MTAKEAYEIIKKEQSGMVAIECLEFPDFYAFGLTEKGEEDEAFGGGYYTVNKISGELNTFTPTQDFEAFFAAKTIDTNTLD